VNVDLIDGAYGLILLAAIAFNSLATRRRRHAGVGSNGLKQLIEMWSTGLIRHPSDRTRKPNDGRFRL
jgi:hypothetical protein